jgi:hypothetical protein
MTDPLNTTPHDEPGSQEAGLRGAADHYYWSSIRGTCGNDHHTRHHAGQRYQLPRDSNAGSLGFRLSLSLPRLGSP